VPAAVILCGRKTTPAMPRHHRLGDKSGSLVYKKWVLFNLIGGNVMKHVKSLSKQIHPAPAAKKPVKAKPVKPKAE
jgi:hypothetical protein